MTIDGRNYTTQEIAASILKKLKADAEEYLKGKVSQAVIAVPAYFGHLQRQAIREAGKIAGLDVLCIINESSAASLAYSVDKNEDQNILVYVYLHKR